jgi:hypothetical protein
MWTAIVMVRTHVWWLIGAVVGLPAFVVRARPVTDNPPGAFRVSSDGRRAFLDRLFIDTPEANRLHGNRHAGTSLDSGSRAEACSLQSAIRDDSGRRRFVQPDWRTSRRTMWSVA